MSKSFRSIGIDEYGIEYFEFAKFLEKNEPKTRSEKKLVISTIKKMLDEPEISYDTKIGLLMNFAIATNEWFYQIAF